MRILITGGAGFVGANLAIHLRGCFPDADIVCMDNLYRRGSELNLPRLAESSITFQKGDVRDAGGFPSGPFDVLVECSAEPSVVAGRDGRLEDLFHTNLIGAFNSLEKAREWNSRFLFFSTSRVYPIARLESHPWSEEATRFAWTSTGDPDITPQGVRETLDMHGARSMYGYTKYAAELLVAEYRSAWSLKTVVNRCGTIAGPWQFGKVDQGVLTWWVLAHHFGIPLTYVGYGGSGKQVRDFLHIADLCELASEQLREFDAWDGWVGNVAGGLGNSTSLLELTTLCSEVTGRRTQISREAANRPEDVRMFVGDCARLFQRTSWRPGRSVRQIVADTARWVAEHESLLVALVPRPD